MRWEEYLSSVSWMWQKSKNRWKNGGANETKMELTPTEINLIKEESKIHMPDC